MPKQLLFSDDARRVNLFVRPLSVFILLTLCLYAQNNEVVAQYPTQNPIRGTMTVHFIRNGVPDYETIDVDGIWVVLFPQWNGRSTINGKMRITNVDTSMTFPCGTKNITADEVNAYWDAHYNGAIRIGEPMWSCNCHGHSTGLGYWVQLPGYVDVIHYDWENCVSMDEVDVGCSHYQGADHSVKVTKVRPADHIYPYRVVTETTEKMAYAGTYLGTYLLPGGAPIGIQGMFRPR